MWVVTQEGAFLLWQWMLNILTPTNLRVHLFSAAHNPAHTDTEATYAAIELAVGGYTSQVLGSPAVNYTFSALANGYQAQYILLTWAFTGACTVYGCWLSDMPSVYSILAAQFATPFIYGATGGGFSLSVPISLTSQP